jgi:hypothetical protein
MTSFEQRESALEAQFAHQQELGFRARERAVGALAKWAAQRLGKTPQAVESYAAEMVAADVANPSIEATLERISGDLSAASVRKEDVNRMMDLLLADSRNSVRA